MSNAIPEKFAIKFSTQEKPWLSSTKARPMRVNSNSDDSTYPSDV